jgi:hypothetical protein
MMRVPNRTHGLRQVDWTHRTLLSAAHEIVNH